MMWWSQGSFEYTTDWVKKSWSDDTVKIDVTLSKQEALERSSGSFHPSSSISSNGHERKGNGCYQKNKIRSAHK